MNRAVCIHACFNFILIKETIGGGRGGGGATAGWWVMMGLGLGTED